MCEALAVCWIQFAVKDGGNAALEALESNFLQAWMTDIEKSQ